MVARSEQQDLTNAFRLTGNAGWGDSVRITAIVTTEGASQNDTLRTGVVVPALNKQAFVDSLSPCGIWSAFTQQRSDGVYVVHGHPFGRELQITQAKAAPSPASARDHNRKCASEVPSAFKYVAFIPGGLGSMASSPVTLRYNGQDNTHTIDPAEHTIAAPIKFRSAELRESTRGAGRLRMRIRLDAASGRDIIPLVVIGVKTDIWRYSTQFTERVAPGTWDFEAHGAGPNDTWVYVYLIRRN